MLGFFSVRNTSGATLHCVVEAAGSCEGPPSTIEDVLRDIRTRSREPSVKTAVLCHGLFSHKDTRLLKDLSSLLLHDACLKRVERSPAVDCVVRFDFHGEGESEGLESWSFGGYDDEVQDLRAVVQAIEALGCSVVLIVGHSRAATVALLYEARYGVPCVAALAGRVAMKTGIDARFTPEQLQSLSEGRTVYIKDAKGGLRKVTQTCLLRRLGVDVKRELLDAAARLQLGSRTVIVLVHCRDDSVVPFEQAKELHGFIEEKGIAKSLLCLCDTGGHALAGDAVSSCLREVFREALLSMGT